MVCHYWYFKDIGYKLEAYTCNKCYYIPMMVHDLDGFLILNGKCFDYRCILWNITKNDAINRLNNSQLDDKATL